MRITRKVFLLFIPTFVLSVVAVSLFAKRAVESVLVEEVIANARSISLSLAQSPEAVASFRTGDEPALLALLQQIDDNMGTEYVMVVDRSRRVLAHTNVMEQGKEYTDDFTTAAVRADGPLHRRAQWDGRPIVDLSYPLWEVDREPRGGEEYLLLGDRQDRARRRLATIRMALPLGPVLDTADQISNQVLWIVALVNLLAMGNSLFGVRKILRPVHSMAAATERLGQGELGETVPVLSNDEMGQLALSFNRMSRDLAATTVSMDFLDSILAGMRDLLLVVNADGTIRMLNRSVCDLLGYSDGELIGQPAVRLFASGERPCPTDVVSRQATMQTRGGRHVPVLLSVARLKDASGGEAEEGCVVSAVDLSERVEAEEQIKRSLQDKEILLKEIHHRVKNNLQIISSLLNLQSEFLSDRRGTEMFRESQNRVKSMALIHEKLYLSDDLARLDYADYVQSLATSLFQSYGVSPGVGLSVSVAGVSLGIDQAIPCGLIINELVSNSLKHAFPGGTGTLSIDLCQTGQCITLAVSDDGIGLADDVDVHTTGSLGLKLVNILVGQLAGTVRVDRGAGTRFTIEFERRAAGPVTG